MTINIVHLYAKELNIYGDTGNILVLRRRLEWLGYDVKVTTIGVGERIPLYTDFIMAGGGQDSNQSLIEADLLSKKNSLLRLIDRGMPMLLVCGSYQLFGQSFKTHEGKIIEGLGILPIKTEAKAKRLIGNIVIEWNKHKIVGFENHSGQTVLDKSNGVKSLGKVLQGFGNDEESKEEGCRYKNIFGTYMHGPILAKNPELADEIIAIIMKNKNIARKHPKLDDSIEVAARNQAMKRPQ